MKHTVGTLCIITLFAIMLSAFLPIDTASADGSNADYTQEIVARLEDPQYTEAITLVQDVDVQDRSCIEIAGPEGHEKVLDLNGHTLSCKCVDNHGNFRVVDSVGGGVLVLNFDYLMNYGTLTVDGATIMKDGSGCVVINNWNGIFHLVSGHVCISPSPEGFDHALENKGGVCMIDGGVISGSIAIYGEAGKELYPVYAYDMAGNVIGSTGMRWHDGTLTINGGLIEGELQVWDTDVTITGGAIRGDAGGLEFRNAAGELVTLLSPTYELHEDNGEMKRGYWDVSVDDWFYVPVQRLMDDGVLDYGEDGNFEPSEPLTRGQAAALLARACGAEVAEEVTEPPFLDVFSSTPYAKYINAGRRAGLLSGDGRGQFYPESTITRQEFAVLVMNAVHKYGLELPPEAPGVAFQDEDAIAPWAVDAVAEGAGYGLWNGTGSGDFLPLAPIARAEGATILARLITSPPP